eukprot:CAMPEP_0183292636 /NCGR_PEP_ID=MMETSP0160_2-20130417/1626_1 /TAXON_ID=2839 ORGANISM="Odontella Sinensis, Strain Grunow 1884" /NCGR_SAMPLE_ID=MMETSP0160_2 /ASSEMBLY_ACC=CAM_ASM_000250 /LENGTH=35 /DNA_ID= /DNA_START= /DNA_END= /DNA_ORIENTATION=
MTLSIVGEWDALPITPSSIAPSASAIDVPGAGYAK